MARRLVRTTRADEDLIAIWLRIGRDAPADRMLDAIDSRCAPLAEKPPVPADRQNCTSDPVSANLPDASAGRKNHGGLSSSLKTRSAERAFTRREASHDLLGHPSCLSIPILRTCANYGAFAAYTSFLVTRF